MRKWKLKIIENKAKQKKTQENRQKIELNKKNEDVKMDNK